MLNSFDATTGGASFILLHGMDSLMQRKLLQLSFSSPTKDVPFGRDSSRTMSATLTNPPILLAVEKQASSKDEATDQSHRPEQHRHSRGA